MGFKGLSTIHVGPGAKMTLAILSYHFSLFASPLERTFRYKISSLDMWYLYSYSMTILQVSPVINILCFVTSEHLLVCLYCTRPLYHIISLFVYLYESLTKPFYLFPISLPKVIDILYSS